MSARFDLIKEVIHNSVSDNWDDAVKEWDVFDHEEDFSASSQCICSKTGLRYLFTIRNKYNGNILFPIGSECIHKFERDDLIIITSSIIGIYKLYHAINDGERIELSSEYFSRNLLHELYQRNMFQIGDYSNDANYQFMLRMFNQRSIYTTGQNKRINGIIMGLKENIRLHFIK